MLGLLEKQCPDVLRPLPVWDKMSQALIILQIFLVVLLLHPCLMEHGHGPVQYSFCHGVDRVLHFFYTLFLKKKGEWG